MKKASCNGIQINYNCVGEGTDIVLIHGLAANHAFWRIEVLMALARNYRVTVFDLRGHGYSDMPSEGYTSRDMVDDLHELLAHVGIAEAHLIGHSLGGVIALHYAALYPEKVLSLCVADSRVRALQPTNYPADWPNWDRVKQKLEEIGLLIPEDEVESGLWLLERIASPEWQSKRDKFEGNPVFVPFSGWSSGHRAAKRWLELMKNTKAREEIILHAGLTREMLSGIRHPVLLLYGENSSALPSCRGLKECVPNSTVQIVPGAGHFFPLTIPKLFADIAIRFISETEEVKLC